MLLVKSYWKLTEPEDIKDLTEAEDIKKRSQEYIEELYQKDVHDPDNHGGVITHLESDILECEGQVGLRKYHYKQSQWRWWLQLSYFKS